MICANNELEKHNALLLTNDMLKKGENEINKYTDIDKETVLVLGNAGCGKTTITQLMAGDNNKLMSLEVGNDTNEFIIVDGYKIRTSPTESETLYPEQVKYNCNLDVSYTDTPGFSDTRSSNHELVATFVMKKYLKNIKRIKIVLVITHNSLQYGITKNDFIELLRNINNFFKDIDVYKKSIVLIANKVQNSYKKLINGKFSLVPDKNILLSILGFIREVKSSLK